MAQTGSQQSPSFSHDLHPGRPHILFVGPGASTHTHAWIDLLNDRELNVRLFDIGRDTLIAPDDWKVPTYVTPPYVTRPIEGPTRACRG